LISKCLACALLVTTALRTRFWRITCSEVLGSVSWVSLPSAACGALPTRETIQLSLPLHFNSLLCSVEGAGGLQRRLLERVPCCSLPDATLHFAPTPAEALQGRQRWKRNVARQYDLVQMLNGHLMSAAGSDWRVGFACWASGRWHLHILTSDSTLLSHFAVLEVLSMK
jgi:hypothetical protein